MQSCPFSFLYDLLGTKVGAYLNDKESTLGIGTVWSHIYIDFFLLPGYDMLIK